MIFSLILGASLYLFRRSIAPTGNNKPVNSKSKLVVWLRTSHLASRCSYWVCSTMGQAQYWVVGIQYRLAPILPLFSGRQTKKNFSREKKKIQGLHWNNYKWLQLLWRKGIEIWGGKSMGAWGIAFQLQLGEWERVSPSGQEQSGSAMFPVQKEKHVPKPGGGRKFGGAKAPQREPAWLMFQEWRESGQWRWGSVDQGKTLGDDI